MPKEPTANDTEKQAPAMTFAPGEIAPHWYSPSTDPEISDGLKKELERLANLIGNKDIAARRFEVEQAWEARLFARGYQHLLPRSNGGWKPVFGLNPGNNSGQRPRYYETNIYTTYLEIVRAALTRDVPNGKFEPQNPLDDADITAADSASKYAKIFNRNNNLLGMLEQLVDYLCTDGRVVILTDYVLDAQRFGWDTASPDAVPEDETQLSNVLIYLVRHGETEANAAGVTRPEDESIDDNGETQTKKAAQFLAGKGIKRIVSSPLPRAQQSAQIISQGTGVPVETDDRLAALDKGDFTGQAKEDASEGIGQAFDEPSETIPGGSESPDDFGNRVQSSLFEALNSLQANPESGPIAFILHDSGLAEANKIFSGEEGPTANVVAPGGVAAITASEGGGFDMQPAFGQANTQMDGDNREPRGQEVAEVYGKLEAKVVPINSQSVHEALAVQVSREYDVAIVKAMFPEIADKIKPGSAGAGENELDRIARINACLALEASYVTGDSMVRDCTVQRDFIRPAFFMEIENAELKNEAFETFPQGVQVIMAGETFARAFPCVLNDHVTIIQSSPGSGQNRIALLSKLVSIQKRVNNWVDLINAFFVKTVPMKWMDSTAFDVQAIQQQGNEPGGIGSFQRQPGVGFNDLMGVEPMPTHQSALPDFIKYFIEELPQLLSHALPTLFGSDSNTDTVGGAMIQRDQALGTLGTPWHNIQEGMCSVYRQAAQLAARCRRNQINESVPGEGIVQVEVADLKGNILCYPEQDANFPESSTQRQARFERIVSESVTNPILGQMLALPKNLKIAKDAIGLKDFSVPAAVAYDKQLGELKILLQSGPMPNPQYVQLEQKTQQETAKYQQGVAAGAVPDPQAQQLLGGAQKMLQSMPQLVSSVPIADTDLHDAEASCCLDWLNAPEGRRYKNGTAKEQAAYLNVHTHWAEHDKEAEAKKSKALQPLKPPTITMNVKDLPPNLAAQAAQQRGLDSATPADFAQQDMAQTIEHHPGEAIQ